MVVCVTPVPVIRLPFDIVPDEQDVMVSTVSAIVPVQIATTQDGAPPQPVPVVDNCAEAGRLSASQRSNVRIMCL